MRPDPAGRSILAFVVYVLGMGVVLTFIPGPLLKLFQFPEEADPWIRIVGMLCFVLAYYYTQVVRVGFREFYFWTVHTRLLVPVFFLALVLLDLAPPALLLFGAIELVFTLWTFFALRKLS